MIATFKTSDFVANLKAALLAVQTDEARMHQCQVRIELAAGVARFVATNGHWLLVSEAPYLEVVGVDECGKKVLGSSEEALCIHRADVVAILKALKSSKKAADWDVELDTRGTVSQMGR